MIDVFEVHSAARPQPTRGTAILAVCMSGMPEPRATIHDKGLCGRGMKLRLGLKRGCWPQPRCVRALRAPLRMMCHQKDLHFIAGEVEVSKVAHWCFIGFVMMQNSNSSGAQCT